MNKKTIFKMGLLMLVGALIGGGASVLLINSEDELGRLLSSIVDIILNVSPYLYPSIFLVLFLPSVYLVQKGKKLLIESESVEEDKIDALEKKSNKYITPAVTLNGIFMLTNFLLLGTTFKASGQKDLYIVLFFMINSIVASTFEILLVKSIQKHDARLKGDPTSFKFQKDFLASMDEAEKLTTFKSGYEAFQFTRMFNFAIIIIMILFNMLFDSGALSVAIPCFMGFAQIISYSVYSSKNENPK